MPKFKTFCKWKEKDLEKHMDIFTKLIDEPKYFCRKCARVSNNKKALCKASKLPVKALY